MSKGPSTLSWRKRVAARNEEAWLERLAFLGGHRLACISTPGSELIRIEAFSLSAREGLQLTSRFGGILRSSSEPLKGRQASRPPVNIRGRLLIVDSGEGSKPVRPRFFRHKVLIIPAGAAFGTGDHATTSSCLRLLADVSDEYAGRRWRCLDLGTGTGILAMAAEHFGADAIDAWDFDKDAVRTAKENARVNEMKHLRLAVRDVLRWTPERQWDVICANLYSGVLIQAATKICEALLPGGKLIVSGILRAQEADCLKAFNELNILSTVRKGKWVAVLATK